MNGRYHVGLEADAAQGIQAELLETHPRLRDARAHAGRVARKEPGVLVFLFDSMAHRGRINCWNYKAESDDAMGTAVGVAEVSARI